MEIKKKLLWIVFTILAIVVGLYPATYLFLNSKETGLLSTKSRELVANVAYMIAFYIHIALGGLALLTGWSQFIKSWRNKYLSFHRCLGYVYVISVFISSITGFIISLYSTGGTSATVGFCILAVLWFTSIIFAFTKVKMGKIKEHQKWMIRNYALTFAAVTLRIWLPIVLAGGGGFVLAMQVVAWLCWVPNVIVIEIYIRTQNGKVSHSRGPTQAKPKGHSTDIEARSVETLAFKKENV